MLPSLGFEVNAATAVTFREVPLTALTSRWLRPAVLRMWLRSRSKVSIFWMYLYWMLQKLQELGTWWNRMAFGLPWYECDIPDVRHPVHVHAVVVVRTLLGLLDHELPDELLKCCIVQIFRVVPQNFMLVCWDKALKWMSHCEERCVFRIVLLHKHYFRMLIEIDVWKYKIMAKS